MIKKLFILLKIFVILFLINCDKGSEIDYPENINKLQEEKQQISNKLFDLTGLKQNLTF
jgi:hypothetical protein